MYEVGKALSVASMFEIDDVIDPADSRRWLSTVARGSRRSSAAHQQEAPQRRHLVDAMGIGAALGVVVIVVIAATVQLSAGFGFGLAAVPLLALAIDPHDAVVVVLCLATLTNAYQAWSGRQDADRSVVRRLLLGAAVGLPVGLLVFVHAGDRALGAFIGAAVLIAVVVIARGLDLRHAGPRLDVAGGLVSGVLTMSSGVNGPPLVFVLQARHFDQHRFRATITAVFFALDVLSVAAFALTGRIDHEVVVAVAVALPALAVGAATGVALRRHLDARRFRRLVLALLTVAGVSAIVSAFAR